MSFIGLTLTKAGRNLIASAISEEDPLNITHIQLGEGLYNGTFAEKRELSKKVMEIPVKSVKRDGGKVIINCDFNSREAPKGFYLREVGIIGNGVLCYYDNSGDDAEYIDPETEAVIKQKRLRFTLTISSDVTIAVKISSELYALAEEVDAYQKENDKAVDGKLDKTGDGSDVTVAFDQAGTRGNISTGEKLSTVLGKIAKFFADLKKVAFSGSYDDLTDKPTIDSKLSSDSSNAVQNKVLYEEINVLKKSVSDGKSSIASAITSHGVPAGSDATYAELASKIGEMSEAQYNSGNSTGYHNGYNAGYSKGQGDGVNATKKGDATAGNVLAGKTFTSAAAGVNKTGTIPTLSIDTYSVDNVNTHHLTDYLEISQFVKGDSRKYFGCRIPKNTYTGKTGYIASLASNFGDAAAANVLSGKKFTSEAGLKIAGAMPNRGAVSKTLAPGETYAIPAGYHNGSGKVANGVVCTISHVFGFGSMICFPDSKCCVSGHSALLRYSGENMFYTLYPDVACTNISVASKYESCNQFKSTSGGLAVSRESFPVTTGQKYILSVYWLCTTDSEKKDIRFYLLKNPSETQEIATMTNNAGWYYVYSCFEFTSNYTLDNVSLALSPSGKQGVIVIALDIWKKT